MSIPKSESYQEFNADVEVNAMFMVITANGGSFPKDFPATPLERSILKVAYARDLLSDNSLEEKSRIETWCGKCNRRTHRFVRNMDASCKSCDEQLEFYDSAYQLTRYTDAGAKKHIQYCLSHQKEVKELVASLDTISVVSITELEAEATQKFVENKTKESKKRNPPRLYGRALYPVIPGGRTLRPDELIESRVQPQPQTIDPPIISGVTFLIQGL